MTTDTTAPRLIVIDGINYTRETPVQESERRLLAQLYGQIWTEAVYDPDSDQTQKYAQRLLPLIQELNKTMEFKK